MNLGVIEKNKKLFTSNLYGESNNLRIILEEEGKKVDSKKLSVLNEILTSLFPACHYIYNNRSYSNEYWEKWSRQQKICIQKYFDHYFSLSIPEEIFDTAKMKVIINLASNYNDLKNKFMDLNKINESDKQSELKLFLKELPSFISEIDEDQAKVFLQVIFDISDEIDIDESINDFGFNTHQILRWLAKKFIIRINDVSDRFEFLKQIYENTVSISLPLRTIDSFIGEDIDNDLIGVLNEEQIKTLQKITLLKIRKFCETKKFSKAPYFGNLLYCWERLEGTENIINYIKQLIHTDEGLIDYIMGFLNQRRRQNLADAYSTITYIVPNKYIKKFLGTDNLDGLIVRSRKILQSSHNLTERQRLALNVFIQPNNDSENEFMS